MKNLFLFGALLMMGASLSSALASTYCMGIRSVEAYSSKVTYQANCNGKKIRTSTGWFGRYGEGLKLFKDELHDRGYTLLGSFSNDTLVVFSSDPRALVPSCLIEARYLAKCNYHVECKNDDAQVTIPFSKTALDKYLINQRLEVLHQMTSVDSPRNAGQCKGADRYFLVK